MLRLQGATRLKHLSNEALSESSRALSERLGAEVEASARLLPNVVRLSREELSTSAAVAEIDLSQLGARAHLEVELPLLVGAIEHLASGQANAVPATCLTPLEEVAFCFLGTLALARLRKVGDLDQAFGPRWVRVVSPDGTLAHEGQQHFVVSIRLSIAGCEGLARLWLPANAICQAVLLDEPSPTRGSLPEVLAHTRLPLSARMGRASFSQVHFKQLVPGDVVLFEGLERLAEGLSGPGRLLASGFQLRGHFKSNGFTLHHLSTRTPEGAVMNGSLDPARSSSVPVEIEVQLSRSWVSLSELSGLGPGGVLPLHVGSHAPVRLKAGDRTFAIAELVDIDGQIGARILSLEEVAP